MTISTGITEHAALKAALEELDARKRRPTLINVDGLQGEYRTVLHRIRYATGDGGYGYLDREEYFIENE